MAMERSLVRDAGSRDLVYGFAVHERTLFARLIDIYPECEVLIHDSPLLSQLLCFEDICHRNQNCQEKLARRVLALHAALAKSFPLASSLILYWRRRDRAPATVHPLSGIGGALLDLRWERDPRLIGRACGYVLNPSGLRRLMQLGEYWSWKPDPSLFLSPAASVPGDAALVSLGADIIRPPAEAIAAAAASR